MYALFISTPELKGQIISANGGFFVKVFSYSN